jgi:hypothetical protein
MNVRPDSSAKSGGDVRLVRAAVRVGHLLGNWRRQRAAAAQDAYIAMWKAAWAKGSQAGWSGAPKAAVPHQAGPEHDAWSAGWEWAMTHPDRRDPNRLFEAHDQRRTTDVRSRVVRAAKRSAVGLGFLAGARWFWQARRRSQFEPAEDSDGPDEAPPQPGP